MDLTDYYIKGNVTMSLITKRQLPNLNNDRFRQLNSIVIRKFKLFYKRKYFFLSFRIQTIIRNMLNLILYHLNKQHLQEIRLKHFYQINFQLRNNDS
jgi:hypothetical protein